MTSAPSYSIARRSAWSVLFVCIAVLIPALALASHADARPSLARGFAERLFASLDPAVGDQWFDQAAAAGAGIARIDAVWGSVAPARPSDPTDPSDPNYNFAPLDAAVRASAAHGFTTVLLVYYAPDWAEAADPPADSPDGTWKPDPKALGDFAEALARRYSGSFGDLPEVRYFEAWNEPNLSEYITPQYRGHRRVGAERYRRMLNAFYKGVKRGNRDAKVIGGATAPFGDDPPNVRRTRPLSFLRELFCLPERSGKRKELRSKGCPNPPKFDILSHHPITLKFSPWRQPLSPEDVTVANFRRVGQLLRKAERQGTLGTGGRHPLWATEMWWESKPPDRSEFGMPISRLKRWVPATMYSLWKQGTRALIWLQIVDTPVANDGFSHHQTGIFFSDGTKKPYYDGFRFPFVTERQRGKRDNEVVAWGIPPASGQLQIQRKNGDGWHTVERGQAREGKPFQTTLRIPGSAKLRAMVAGEASLTWKQKAPGAARKATRGKRHRRLAPRSQAAQAATADPALAPYYEAFGG